MAFRDALRTLRFRLTLWNTAVVLLVVGATLIGVHEGLRLIMVHEVDRLLEEDLLEIELALVQAHPEVSRAHQEIEHMALGHARRGLFVQLFDSRGRPLWSSSNTPANLPDGLKPLGASFINSAGEYRILQSKFALPDQRELTVRVGSSWDLGATDFRTFTWLMLTMGAAALLLAPLGGFVLAGWVTRALGRIIDTTARLKPAALDERLEIRGSGDELDRLSLTINAFLDRLGEHLEKSRRFTADAAHELRSPLAAMHSALEVALHSERSSEEYKELIAELLEECDRLRRLANQLLVLAESDAHSLLAVATPVALEQVTRKALDMFQGVAEAAGIELVSKNIQPLQVLGDRGRLRQVVDNLIDNALKFTPANGQVIVELAKDAAHGQAVLTVQDTGIGIRREEVPQMFERFWQADRARSSKGAGLGLSICQAIVVAHAGVIAARSTPGAGTILEVRLPLHVPAQEPPG